MRAVLLALMLLLSSASAQAAYVPPSGAPLSTGIATANGITQSLALWLGLLPNMFVVSTTGNDSNPGTYNSPFLTLAHAQTAMRASSTTKTTCLRTGTYVLSSLISMNSSDNGETWMGCPGDVAQSAIIQYAASPPQYLFEVPTGPVSNITWTNLNFDGGSSGGAGASDAAILLVNATNIYITKNLFTNSSVAGDITLFCSSNVYVRQNTSVLNELQLFSAIINSGCSANTYGNINVTDNVMTNTRSDIELTAQAANQYWFGSHFDRNIVAGGCASGSNPCISYVSNLWTGAAASAAGSTINDNKFYGTGTGTSVGANEIAIEIIVTNTTMEGNIVDGMQWGFEIGECGGCVIEGNTMINNPNPFATDFGYNTTEWIGQNMIITGFGTGAPTCSTGTTYCMQNGWTGKTYTAANRPAMYAPSAATPP